MTKADDSLNPDHFDIIVKDANTKRCFPFIIGELGMFSEDIHNIVVSVGLKSDIQTQRGDFRIAVSLRCRMASR